MSALADRLRYLLTAYAGKSHTSEEAEELKKLLQDDWNSIEPGIQVPHIDWERMYREITAAPVISIETYRSKRKWYRMAVAAAVLLLCTTTVYYLFFTKATKQQQTPAAALQDVPAPAANRAMITLANGSNVYLDSAGNGMLATQGDVQVVKLADGQLMYKNDGSPELKGDMVYNTLSNPRGSNVISMTLSDGSKIWLNAASSVTYPVAFTGNERKVSITGEAYFEIAHDKTKPFYVTKNEMQVQVLGTHFNVNAYDDEDAIKVTLLQGSVRITHNPIKGGTGAKSIMLKPGEQAQVNQSAIQLVNADVDQAIAWKNGYFAFAHADVKTIMRQLARWYDVDIQYQGTAGKEQFTGEIDRNISLSNVLNHLQRARVHYKIENKQVIVLP